MDAFQGPRDINSYYVDGMSITYGSPRKHIWTYAVGLSDDHNYNGVYNCPCAKYPGTAPPSFVGDHYYCESGNTGAFENTLCGMERVAVMVTTAVLNPECPGSVVLYHRKWRGTLKCVYVLTVGVKSSIWSFLRFTFSKGS